MMVAIPEHFTGSVRRETNLSDFERSINCEPVAIAKIVIPRIPAKLDAAAVLGEEAERKNEFRRHLQQEALFASAAPILVGHDQLITGAQD